MKLLILIGGDIIGVTYKDKRNARRAISNKLRGKKGLSVPLKLIQFRFHGRSYTYSEMKKARIKTLNEFHSEKMYW